ncbi:MAG: Swt1 family HEPN domain-containing protein [Candidatus Rokubacteria bacterium]|nr:Swt1 family HEPN domain-containing protein [Candidatus Rokubacteria bacterium]
MDSEKHRVVNAGLRLPELGAREIAALRKTQALSELQLKTLIEQAFSARPVVGDLDARFFMPEIAEAARRQIAEFEHLAGSRGLELRTLLEQAFSARQALEGFNARFHLPEVTDTARLIAEFQKSPGAEELKKFGEQAIGLKLAIEGMRTPWLDIQEQMRSMAGFAELQGIGHALGRLPAFDKDLAAALRIDLGDWRARITWPAEIFTDAAARSAFYAGRGFDRALTDFPAPAFQESLRIARLRHKPPPLDRRYGAPVPRAEGDEEDSFGRNNRAHDWLQRLETQLRRFIDEQMTQAFGADWPRRRLPNGMYEAWQVKKRKGDQVSGREWPLIVYADFTDYEAVICRRDNWREVFAPFFGRPESVRESLQRLYPGRLAASHSRPITQDDELFIYVEIKRLGKVIIVKGR